MILRTTSRRIPMSFPLPFGRFQHAAQPWPWLGALVAWGLLAAPVHAQVRPYIGYGYPAGGQQGTTVQVKLGGQGLDDVNQVLLTGSGVTGRVAAYYRRLNNQEVQLLNEQIRELKKATSAVATASAPRPAAGAATNAPAPVTPVKPGDSSAEPMMAMTMMSTSSDAPSVAAPATNAIPNLIARLEQRTREFVAAPACAAIATIALVEITIATDAEPGLRELRLATPRGVSNPLAFHIGQVLEYTRTPMLTATLQVLGKEGQSLRKRPANEVEDRVEIPCTVNGQIASGEVNRYRFAARQGQRLVLSTQARQLIPYIADAVPGWFQPVLAVYDANGKELAYDDDYRFQPDPVLLFRVPRDGDYVFEIHDSIYRGREDFLYRITVGELPFVTSVFPLGRRVGGTAAVQMNGWNLDGATLVLPEPDAPEGTGVALARRQDLVSNRVPFALDTLPDRNEEEPNNDPAHAQSVSLPIILNGRIQTPDDWDVFSFTGQSNQVIVAEVSARRLDSPLDSVIKLTDAQGAVLAFNDDREDLAAGSYTHQADSSFMATLPADGTYYVHLGDTARAGSREHGYRLRLSAPQPDFALRVAPSSLSFRGKSSGALTVHTIRKDGFTGPIKLTLKNPPSGFSAPAVTLSGTQAMARITLKCDLPSSSGPIALALVGTAKIGGREVAHDAVPAEDRMQAFLWRHLVPAEDLQVLAFDPTVEPKPKRALPQRPTKMAATDSTDPGTDRAGTQGIAGTNAMGTNGMATNAISTNAIATNVTAATNKLAATNLVAGGKSPATNAAAPAKPQFTKQQIAGRLRQLKLLFEEGLLTDEFYCAKVAECEAAQ